MDKGRDELISEIDIMTKRNLSKFRKYFTLNDIDTINPNVNKRSLEHSKSGNKTCNNSFN